MIQVATFLLPDGQEKANEFFRTHKPVGNINFNKDTLIIFWDDGDYTAAEQIADLQELVIANKKQRWQFEVSLEVMKRELADINPKSKEQNIRHTQIQEGIKSTERTLADHDFKRALAEERIKELQAQLNG